VEKKFPRRDVIRDYSCHDSQVYAPKNRVGVYLDAGAEKYVVNSKYTNTLDGRTRGRCGMSQRCWGEGQREGAEERGIFCYNAQFIYCRTSLIWAASDQRVPIT